MFRKPNPSIPGIQLKKSDWIWIGGCWLIIQLILVRYLGINRVEESTKYIDLANRWIRGDRDYTWNQLFYSGYVGIHVLLHWLGLPAESMYVVQVILSATAAFYFVKICCLFLRSRSAIIFSGILYSTCFIIQQWVSALFTDSVFSSLLIIAVYFLLTDEESPAKKITCLFLLIVLPLFRPVGFLFLILACVYWLFISQKRYLWKVICCMIYLLVISMAISKSLVGNPNFFYPYHNIEANIICGYPGNLLEYRKVPYQDGMSMFVYFTKNPGMSLRLFFFRFIKIFSMGRAYFSPMHNGLLTASCFVYYILALAGIISLIQQRDRFMFFLLAGIIIFSIPSVIFCQDWSGRFSLPVFCFVLLLSGFGVDGIMRFRHSASS
jgi:hypothetical protein